MQTTSPETLAAVIGAVVSLLAAIVSTVFGLVAYRQSQDSQRAATESMVNGLYDRLMEFRVQHPQVLAATRQWTSDAIEHVYSPMNTSDHTWAIYYSYVELCIGYCNAVLSSVASGRLRRQIYEAQHESLVRLLLTENNPIVCDFLREGKYVSRYLVEFRQRLDREGWDWSREHTLLATFSDGIKGPRLAEGQPRMMPDEKSALAQGTTSPN